MRPDLALDGIVDGHSLGDPLGVGLHAEAELGPVLLPGARVVGEAGRHRPLLLRSLEHLLEHHLGLDAALQTARLGLLGFLGFPRGGILLVLNDFFVL